MKFPEPMESRMYGDPMKVLEERQEGDRDRRKKEAQRVAREGLKRLFDSPPPHTHEA